MSTLNSFNNSNNSPFDTIRHIDEFGEYWMARELMPLLGYLRWSDFKPAIDRAICACENTANNVKMHFSGMTLKSQGRPGLDYKLSRFGGYLTAMNGDPRKPEIAAAQSYFAVKTHEAETRASYQVQSSISTEAAQLALMLGEFAGLEKSLTAQLAINAAAAVNPALSPAVNELRTAIACTNTTDDAYLNPTQIGEVVGMSARAVNSWLLNSGLQYKTDDKKIPYRPTDAGKQWGRKTNSQFTIRNSQLNTRNRLIGQLLISGFQGFRLHGFSESVILNQCWVQVLLILIANCELRIANCCAGCQV